MERLVYTVEELASLLGFSQETIRRAIRAGELRAAGEASGRRQVYRVSRIEVDRWWRARGGGDLFPDLVRDHVPAPVEAVAPSGEQES